MKYCAFNSDGLFLGASNSEARTLVLFPSAILVEARTDEDFVLFCSGYFRDSNGEPKPIESVIPEPTPEEIQEQLTVAVQKYLDTTAQKLNYDNCLSVCSYVDTGVAKFDEEGTAFRQWRSAVWEKGYEIVDAVKAGTRDIPTEEELFAELPTIQLDREELKETSTLGLAKVGI